jgi:hypothetical protein
VLADGRVLVAGGTGAGGALSSSEIFDPVNATTGFQLVASPMTAARTHHTATLLNNGTVLIAGGETGGTAEIFDRRRSRLPRPFGICRWRATVIPRPCLPTTACYSQVVTPIRWSCTRRSIKGSRSTWQRCRSCAQVTGRSSLVIRACFCSRATQAIRSTNSILPLTHSRQRVASISMHPAPHSWPTEKCSWLGPM